MSKKELMEVASHGTVMFPLACYEWNGESDLPVGIHWHNQTEIIYFKKGSFKYSINTEEFTVVAPAIAFVPAGALHSIYLAHGQLENAVVFDLNMINFEHYDEIQSKVIAPLISGKIQLPKFLYPNDYKWKDILTLYLRIVESIKSENIGRLLKIKAFLLIIIALLYEGDNLVEIAKIDEPNSYKIERIKNVLTYIHKEYQNKISTALIAREMGMNEQYFCRFFKKITGKTITQYINEVRLEKATQLLVETDEKIIDIANCCGYENIGYFIKRFKILRGQSPQEYRKFQKSQKSVTN